MKSPSVRRMALGHDLRVAGRILRKSPWLRPRKYVFFDIDDTSTYSRYRTLAIIECDVNHTPKIIKDTHKGNARIIEIWHHLVIDPRLPSAGYRLAQRMKDDVNEFNAREKEA